MIPGIAPGYTVACFGVAEPGLNALADSVGRQGRVVSCLSESSPPSVARLLPRGGRAASAVLRCSGRWLPLLSHAVDVAVAAAALCCDEAFVAELRRVVVPGGMLVFVDVPAGDGPRSALIAAIAGAGFAPGPAAEQGLIQARAPRGRLP
jgi:hypothetical protein